MISTSDKKLELIKSRPLYWINKPVAGVEFGLCRRGTKMVGVVGDDIPDIVLSESDFSAAGNEFRYESDGEFPVGCAISRACTLNLKQSDKYSAQDFDGGTLDIVITIDGDELVDDDYEVLWMFMGRYYVQKAYDQNGKIVIEANDAMASFDRIYEPPSGLPADERTLLKLYQTLCEELGFRAGTRSFTNDDYTYPHLLYGYTYREIFGFIAALAGGNAFIHPAGNSIIIQELPTEVQTLDKWKDIEVAAQSLTISGVELLQTVNLNNQELEEPILQKSTIFRSGYAFHLENPLVDMYNPAISRVSSLDNLAKKLVGRMFRDFSGSHICYPPAELGDLVLVKHNGGEFYTHLTGVKWTPTGASELECKVEDLSCLRLYCDIEYESEYNEDAIPSGKLVAEGYVITEEDLPALECGDIEFGGWYYDEGYKRLAEVGDEITANARLRAKWSYNMEQYDAGYAAGYAQAQTDGVSSGAHPSDSSVSVPVYRALYINVTTDSATGSTVYQIEEKGQRWELLDDSKTESYRVGYEAGYKYGYKYASQLNGSYLEALEYIWDEPTATLTVEERVGSVSELPENTYTKEG